MPSNLRGAAAVLNPFSNMERLGILGVGFTLGSYKVAPQSVASSAVLVADTALALNLGATGYWLVELEANLLILNAAQNIRYAFTGPDGLVMEANVSRGRGWLNISGVVSQEDPLVTSGAGLSTITGGTTSAWTSMRLRIGVHVTQPGTLQFQWAQNVSGAPATTVQEGSTMKAIYLANNLGI